MDNDKFFLVEEAHQKVTEILSALSLDVTIVVGGGAIRDLAFDLEGPNDFDMYILPENNKDLTTDEVVKVVNEAVSLLEYSFPITENVITKQELSRFPELEKQHCTVKLLDARIEKDGIPYQFLYKNHSNTPQELIEFFDLDICQFGYDGEQFYIGSKVDLDVVEKALFEGGPLTLLQPTSTFSRLKKFRDRYSCKVGKAVRDLQEAWSGKRGTSPNINMEFLGTPKDESQIFYWAAPKSVLDKDFEIECEDEDLKIGIKGKGLPFHW